MVSRHRVYVEVVNGLPVRVFRNRVDAVLSTAYTEERVTEWSRAGAISAIRQQVYERADGHCERCGCLVSVNQAHLDEKVSKGDGGEVSIFNCQILCSSCHITHPNAKHGDRRWNGRRKI